MQADPHERALTIFDAFLRYARDAGTPPAQRKPTAPTLPAITDAVSDEVTDPNLPNPSTVATRVAPIPTADDFEDRPTRVSPMSEAIASSLLPLGDESVWDEATRERQDVVQELRAQLRPSDHPPAIPAKAPPQERGGGSRSDTLQSLPVASDWSAPGLMPAPQASIIVDEDDLTETGAGDSMVLDDADVAPDATGVHFVREMQVLFKYGHGAQVPTEIARWRRAHADDLAAQQRVTEFELDRVDAAAGVESLFALASKALDVGDIPLARDVLDRVLRAAPQDLRVNALRGRLGRR